MSKMMISFIYIVCLNPVTSTGRTSVDFDAGAKLDLVDKFHYLSDMVSVDVVVKTRIQIRLNKFRQLVQRLTNMDISLIMRGRLYSSCV